MTSLHLETSIARSPLRLHFLLIPLALACFALLPEAQAVSPAPDGGYPNQNTAEGDNALFSLTTGSYNTANGNEALFSNTTGTGNTATGLQALLHNTIGIYNTANGYGALFKNTGNYNTATGADALLNNTTGINNTANGLNALYSNTSGIDNMANGVGALKVNTTGGNNTANGFQALYSNTTGGSNIALGVHAGLSLTTGNNNIDIGNVGVAGESDKIRIGTVGTQNATFVAGVHGVAVTGSAVVVSSSGQLGVAPSSKRFKDEITPMDKVSEAILALKPVTFRYKQVIDPAHSPQFGLVAEEVAKINPDLVTRDAKDEPYTVRYEAVNAMLLNEFLKAHCKMQEQEATIIQLKSGAAKQDATIATLTESLKEQAAQIQKVSAKIEVSKSAPQVVNNP
jgi:hypothetical protein